MLFTISQEHEPDLIPIIWGRVGHERFLIQSVWEIPQHIHALLLPSAVLLSGHKVLADRWTFTHGRPHGEVGKRESQIWKLVD